MSIFKPMRHRLGKSIYLMFCIFFFYSQSGYGEGKDQWQYYSLFAKVKPAQLVQCSQEAGLLFSIAPLQSSVLGGTNAPEKPSQTIDPITWVYWATGGGIGFLVLFGILMLYRSKDHIQKLQVAKVHMKEQQKALEALEEKLRLYDEEVEAQRDVAYEYYLEVRQKEEEVKASFRYASNIQQALLPLPTRLEHSVPEHFVIYKPKDYVSGDFYWYEELNGKLYFAVADCTGHGVPGALISMLASNMLTQAILQHPQAKQINY